VNKVSKGYKITAVFIAFKNLHNAVNLKVRHCIKIVYFWILYRTYELFLELLTLLNITQINK
jgi:hypothetical protein